MSLLVKCTRGKTGLVGRDPHPLVVETASLLQPGRALDLACGTGRNALWLADRGWTVTALDRSAEAIAALQRIACIDARVADLEKSEYAIEPAAWDLIIVTYYLQRDLFEPAKRGVKPGGALLSIVLLEDPGENPGRYRMKPGELAGYFRDWEILHSYEGLPHDSSPHRVAEIAARRITSPNRDASRD
jgi:tellurite methyltransferase